MVGFIHKTPNIRIVKVKIDAAQTCVGTAAISTLSILALCFLDSSSPVPVRHSRQDLSRIQYHSHFPVEVQRVALAMTSQASPSCVPSIISLGVKSAAQPSAPATAAFAVEADAAAFHCLVSADQAAAVEEHYWYAGTILA